MKWDEKDERLAEGHHRGLAKTGRLDAGATLFDVNRAKPDRLLLVSDRARIYSLFSNQKNPLKSV